MSQFALAPKLSAALFV